MRCTCLRWLVLAGGILALNVLPVLAQSDSASGADSMIHALHHADTTRVDSTGLVHSTYETIQSVYQFLRRVADPIMHFFERLWHTITKETAEHDSILRFPLGNRKS